MNGTFVEDTRHLFVRQLVPRQKVFVVDVHPVGGIDVRLFTGAYQQFNPVFASNTSRNNLRLKFDNPEAAWSARNLFENSVINGIVLSADLHEHVKKFDAEDFSLLELKPVKTEARDTD